MANTTKKTWHILAHFFARLGGTLVDVVTLVIAAFTDPKSRTEFRWFSGIGGLSFHLVYAAYGAKILWFGKEKHDRKFGLFFILLAVAGLFFSLTLIIQLAPSSLTPLMPIALLLPAIYMALTFIFFIEFAKKAIESQTEEKFLNKSKEIKKLFFEFLIGLLILIAFLLEETNWLGASTKTIYNFMATPLPFSSILFLLSMLLNRLNEENLGEKPDKYSVKYKYFLGILVLSIAIDAIASIAFSNSLILVTLGDFVVTGPLLGFVAAILLYVSYKAISALSTENPTLEKEKDSSSHCSRTTTDSCSLYKKLPRPPAEPESLPPLDKKSRNDNFSPSLDPHFQYANQGPRQPSTPTLSIVTTDCTMQSC